MKQQKFTEFCRKSPDLYHRSQLIKERSRKSSDWSRNRLPDGSFYQELFQEKEYKCDYCGIKKIILFDEKEKPYHEEDMKHMAYLFARDFIQPSHPHFEMLNGKGVGDEVRQVHRKTHEANLKTIEFKEWNQDFKQHYAKKRHWY